MKLANTAGFKIQFWQHSGGKFIPTEASGIPAFGTQSPVDSTAGLFSFDSRYRQTGRRGGFKIQYWQSSAGKSATTEALQLALFMCPE